MSTNPENLVISPVHSEIIDLMLVREIFTVGSMENKFCMYFLVVVDHPMFALPLIITPVDATNKKYHSNFSSWGLVLTEKLAAF